MSKLEEQKALPRRPLFRLKDGKLTEKQESQIKRLKTQGLIARSAGSKLARLADEGRIGRSHLGLNPEGKRKAKKAKGKR